MSEDGVITLRDVPFRRGESVEIIVLPAVATAPDSLHLLRGIPAALIDPTEPVAEAEWKSAG